MISGTDGSRSEKRTLRSRDWPTVSGPLTDGIKSMVSVYGFADDVTKSPASTEPDSAG